MHMHMHRLECLDLHQGLFLPIIIIIFPEVEDYSGALHPIHRHSGHPPRPRGDYSVLQLLCKHQFLQDLGDSVLPLHRLLPHLVRLLVLDLELLQLLEIAEDCSGVLRLFRYREDYLVIQLRRHKEDYSELMLIPH